MELPDPRSCRSCGAPIYWALTEAGKRMPVDADPSPAGTCVLTLEDRGLRVAVLTDHALDFARRNGRALRTSHFATCPDAAGWRGRPRGTAA